MLIERPPEWYRRLFPGAIFRMPPSGRNPGTVFITFDDGPIPDVTPAILDILDDFGVKATFFMVGQNVERYPGLFHEVRERGHLTANHTLHHIRGWKVDPEIYLDDVDKGGRLTQSNLLRPPHGWLSPAQLKRVSHNYRVIMFDLVTRDYSKRVSAARIVENVKKFSRDGSIIVFHDSLKSYHKLKRALPESLEWLRSQGYKFGLISDHIK